MSGTAANVTEENVRRKANPSFGQALMQSEKDNA
jgi:hypothetical protein